MNGTRISSLLGKVTALVLICFFCLPVQAKYGGGSGEPNDPYLIYDVNHMQAIGADPCDWDKCFKLMADVDLGQFTGTEFNIIGVYIGYNDPSNKPFSGVFDGNNLTISNFTYDSNDKVFIGLFGYVVDLNTIIKNLGLINAKVSGEYNVGSLIGHLTKATISNCYAEGGSVKGRSGVGGLVGTNDGGTITNCNSNNSVSGDSSTGGLAGGNNGTIKGCYSRGDVSGDNTVGGLVGTNSATVTNCYSNGSTSGYHRVGGLVGYNWWGMPGNNRGTITNCYTNGSVYGAERITGGVVGVNSGRIINCYSRVSVTGDGDYAGGIAGIANGESILINCYAAGRILGGGSYFGGILGYSDMSDTLSTCYWDIETSGLNNMCGDGDCNDLNGKTTIEMQQQSTFTGWDFVNIWTNCEGTNYPRFFWQIHVADFICPDGVDFIDYSFFSLHWLEDDCGSSNDCDGTDLDQLGRVDSNDLAIFLDNWLTGVKMELPLSHACNPNPPDGGIGVKTTANLSWTAGVGATSHDIYFGTCDSPPFRGNQNTTIFDPGTMAYSTMYFWRVEEIGVTGKTNGLIWSFTTPPPPPLPP
jgi:hypothetical protein